MHSEIFEVSFLAVSVLANLCSDKICLSNDTIDLNAFSSEIVRV